MKIVIHAGKIIKITEKEYTRVLKAKFDNDAIEVNGQVLADELICFSTMTHPEASKRLYQTTQRKAKV